MGHTVVSGSGSFSVLGSWYILSMTKRGLLYTWSIPHLSKVVMGQRILFTTDRLMSR